ncbi:helix-turn-helix domain-containing protein [Streptomyces sp. NPDC004752]
MAHRSWLEPLRSRFVASGLTLDELVGRSGYSKTRLSELLGGKGYYPRWEITYSVVRALDIPVGPLRRLWQAAAWEADKDADWIRNRIGDVQPGDGDEQPVAHQGLAQAMWQPYTAYAQAFLQTEQRARQAAGETFDILWLTWDEATASPDTPGSCCVRRSSPASPGGPADTPTCARRRSPPPTRPGSPTWPSAWPTSRSSHSSSTRSPACPPTRWTSPSCGTCAASTRTPSRHRRPAPGHHPHPGPPRPTGTERPLPRHRHPGVTTPP